ncbi:MAG: class I SAM-dependent methyltransferase [Actinomycetota bacterium]
MTSVLPVPPSELVHRVGKIDDPDVAAAYEAIGRGCRERIERLLPEDWSWDGKRVLDFGCGAGRTLRHFLAEAERAEFYGCDIDRPSVSWVTNHFSPPLHVFENEETPSLPQPDEFFDLVYALSVFTHLTDHWAGWLLELHRVLKPDGLLFATFLNEGLWSDFGHGAWEEDRVGMNVIKKWNPWESGGPIVFHSEWWIREHWGRLFDVLFLERHDPSEAPRGQGAALLRRRPVRLGSADLERSSNDPRELEAERHNVEQLHQEAGDLFAQLSHVSESHEALEQNVEGLRTEIDRLQADLAMIARSRSWRFTAPLRTATAALRRRGA